jgi:hypothetical protein
VESLGLWSLVRRRPLSWHHVASEAKLLDWIRQMGEAELLDGGGIEVSTTIFALLKHDAWNWVSSQEEDREDCRGVPIRCTQGDVVILEKGAESTAPFSSITTGVFQVLRQGWFLELSVTTQSVILLPWIPNPGPLIHQWSPRKLFQSLPSPACDLLLLRSRSLTLQQILCPVVRVPTSSMGRARSAGGGGESI